jgi:hypothetical protein
MKEWMIKTVLAWVAGITAGQWEAALETVLVAGRRLKEMTGAEKRDYVVQTLRLSWPELKSTAANLLVEMAVGVARKRGYLK